MPKARIQDLYCPENSCPEGEMHNVLAVRDEDGVVKVETPEGIRDAVCSKCGATLEIDLGGRNIRSSRRLETFTIRELEVGVQVTILNALNGTGF